MISKRRVIHPPVYSGLVSMLEALFIEGKRTPGVLKSGFSANRKWGGRDRRIVAEVIYESVRWWRRLYLACNKEWSDQSLRHHGDGPRPTSKQIAKCLDLQIVRLGIEIPGRNLTVDLAEELQAYDAISSRDASSFYSASDYFFQLGLNELGESWLETLEALNEPAPVFLRINRIKVESLEELAESLNSEGIEVESVDGAPDALRLTQRRNVFVTEAYKRGWFEMQDASSQIVASMIKPQKGEKIIDACAGAGGKSLHLSSLMRAKGKIISMDITKWKLDELRKRAARAGADNIEVRLVEPKTLKRLRDSADVLVLDVPCSGSGVLRRNADPKWQLNESRFHELLQLQAKLIEDYTKMLKPGGRLLYSTCSLFPSENSGQVEKAMNGVLKGGSLLEEFSNLPQINGQDGFYAALIRKPDKSSKDI